MRFKYDEAERNLYPCVGNYSSIMVIILIIRHPSLSLGLIDTVLVCGATKSHSFLVAVEEDIA